MSKYQNQLRRAYGSAVYPADFERWLARPVYLVQVFTYTINIFAEVARSRTFRVLPKARDAQCLAHRADVARIVRSMRGRGLNSKQVRDWSWRIIRAPESYAGEIHAATRAAVRCEVAERFAL